MSMHHLKSLACLVMSLLVHQTLIERQRLTLFLFQEKIAEGQVADLSQEALIGKAMLRTLLRQSTFLFNTVAR